MSMLVLQLLVPDASFQISVLGHLWSKHQNFPVSVSSDYFSFFFSPCYDDTKRCVACIILFFLLFFFSHSYYPMLLAHGLV